MFKILGLSCLRDGKDDRPCIENNELRCITTHNMQFVWCEHLRAKLDMPEAFTELKVWLEGREQDIAMSDADLGELQGVFKAIFGREAIEVK